MIAALFLAVAALASPIIKRDLDGFDTKCSKSQDTFSVNSITYSPNPIVAGQDVSITVSGVSTKDVVNGSSIHVVAKYLGFITVLDKTLDICTQKGVTCPIVASNNETLSFSFNVPSNTPSLKVAVTATVKNADGSEVVCLENPSLQV